MCLAMNASLLSSGIRKLASDSQDTVGTWGLQGVVNLTIIHRRMCVLVPVCDSVCIVCVCVCACVVHVCTPVPKCVSMCVCVHTNLHGRKEVGTCVSEQ